MLLFDKKRALTTIIDRRRHDDGSTDELKIKPSALKDEEGTPDPRHEAMRNFMSALQSGDVLEALTHHAALMKGSSGEPQAPQGE